MGTKVSLLAAAKNKKKRMVSSLLHNTTLRKDNDDIIVLSLEQQQQQKMHLHHHPSNHSSVTTTGESISVSSATDITMSTSSRTFHHVADSAYWFPNDDEEMDRLIGQHFALKSLFGGNVFDQIIKGLEMDTGNSNAIVLDLGCGPGTWLMDVATEYPSCQFIGLDMCDVFPNNIRPPNVSFQMGNVLKRLPFSDNSFDFVNIRLFIIALKKHEWPIVVNEAYRILKPGGYIQMVECGMLERGNEFVRHAGKIFKQMIDNLGQEAYIAHKLDTLMTSVNFNVIYFQSKDIYLGKSDRLSKEFLWDACNIFKAAQAVIQEPLGYKTENYSQFLDKLYIELQKQPDAIWSFSICIGRKSVVNM